MNWIEITLIIAANVVALSALAHSVGVKVRQNTLEARIAEVEKLAAEGIDLARDGLNVANDAHAIAKAASQNVARLAAIGLDETLRSIGERMGDKAQHPRRARETFLPSDNPISADQAMHPSYGFTPSASDDTKPAGAVTETQEG